MPVGEFEILREFTALNFKRLLASQKDVFGLDIGSSCVKIVALRRDENAYTVIAAAKAEVAGDSIGHSTGADVTNAIRQCFTLTSLKTKYAVCGICGPDVAARRFRFPALSNEEIAGAVLFEAEQVCPFDSGQFIVDYQVLNYGNNENDDDPEQNSETSGVLVAAVPGTIGKRSQLVRSASLHSVLMDVNGMALSNCFSALERGEHPKNVAILDVGSIFTNLAILGADDLPFVRDIQHAGNEIINNICKEYESSPQVVHDALRSLKNENPDNDRLKAGLEKACTKLISGILETLRYYEVHDSCSIEKVFVCGGFGMVDGLVELLDNYLPAQVVLWNPFDKITIAPDISDTSIITRDGPSLAVAAGLAMRTI